MHEQVARAYQPAAALAQECLRSGAALLHLEVTPTSIEQLSELLGPLDDCIEKPVPALLCNDAPALHDRTREPNEVLDTAVQMNQIKSQAVLHSAVRLNSVLAPLAKLAFKIQTGLLRFTILDNGMSDERRPWRTIRTDSTDIDSQFDQWYELQNELNSLLRAVDPGLCTVLSKAKTLTEEFQFSQNIADSKNFSFSSYNPERKHRAVKRYLSDLRTSEAQGDSDYYDREEWDEISSLLAYDVHSQAWTIMKELTRTLGQMKERLPAQIQRQKRSPASGMQLHGQPSSPRTTERGAPTVEVTPGMRPGPLLYNGEVTNGKKRSSTAAMQMAEDGARFIKTPRLNLGETTSPQGSTRSVTGTGGPAASVSVDGKLSGTGVMSASSVTQLLSFQPQHESSSMWGSEPPSALSVMDRSPHPTGPDLDVTREEIRSLQIWSKQSTHELKSWVPSVSALRRDYAGAKFGSLRSWLAGIGVRMALKSVSSSMKHY